jgi:uncharacterized protein (DUF849 family)
MTPVIIEAAINGITNKAQNPHTPIAPQEIAADALACLAAGASVVHSHTDNFADPGAAIAARQLEGWRPVLAARPDAILYPTAGFGGGIEERFAHVPILAEACAMRMSVFDPGSLNLGGVDADGVPGGFDFVYTNSFADIRHEAALCERYRLGPSISIFEPGFLRCALAYHRAGRLPAGAFVKFYFGGTTDYVSGGAGGVGFGLPPTPLALDAYLEMLGDCALPWAVAVIGGDVVASGLARLAIERGGHVRVGLEDFAGPRTPTNRALVAEVVALAGEIGRPVATCSQASEILALPRAVC